MSFELGCFGMNGEPISLAEAKKLMMSIDDRRVDQTTIGNVFVSTVLLVFDHSFGRGPPVIFETMIFGGELDDEQWRYSTRADAEAGHARAVALVELEAALVSVRCHET